MQQRPDSPRRPWETVAYMESPELPDIAGVKIGEKAFVPRTEALLFKELKRVEATMSPDKEKAALFKN